MANVTIVDGYMELDITPAVTWSGEDAAVAIMRAIWKASGNIMFVRIGFDGSVHVRVAVPSDGSMDLQRMSDDLRRLATHAVVRRSER